MNEQQKDVILEPSLVQSDASTWCSCLEQLLKNSGKEKIFMESFIIIVNCNLRIHLHLLCLFNVKGIGKMKWR